MRLAQVTSDERIHAIALEAHTVGMLRPDRSADVLRSADKLVELSERLRDPQLRFDARIFRQYSLLSLGDLVQADRELDQCSQISEAAPNPRRQWQVALLRAARATLRGNLMLAEHFSSSAQDLGSRVHDSSPAHYQLLQGFQRALLRDDLVGWLEGTEVVIARFPTVPAFKVAQALILSRLSRMHLAREALHQLGSNDFAAIPPNNLSLWLLTALAEVAFLTSQKTYATALYRLLLPYAAEYIVAAWGTLLDGSVSHYLALLATVTDNVAASAHFEHAIAANRRIGAPALTARSCLHFSAHLANADSLSEALDLAREAAGTFSALETPRIRASRRGVWRPTSCKAGKCIFGRWHRRAFGRIRDQHLPSGRRLLDGHISGKGQPHTAFPGGTIRRHVALKARNCHPRYRSGAHAIRNGGSVSTSEFDRLSVRY